jgi:hypothetical protein
MIQISNQIVSVPGSTSRRAVSPLSVALAVLVRLPG